mmetsp:Transcript_23953/g.73352  ORF Transcript_23953/g.73352 Transcript_23953/m.73352 type:complete len:237 (-) Transcript_23953:937-1647(-)|eukprot:scaffold120901_cov30-Tisochrysis_lutea.AAC.2
MGFIDLKLSDSRGGGPDDLRGDVRSCEPRFGESRLGEVSLNGMVTVASVAVGMEATGGDLGSDLASCTVGFSGKAAGGCLPSWILRLVPLEECRADLACPPRTRVRLPKLPKICDRGPCDAPPGNEVVLAETSGAGGSESIASGALIDLSAVVPFDVASSAVWCAKGLARWTRVGLRAWLLDVFGADICSVCTPGAMDSESPSVWLGPSVPSHPAVLEAILELVTFIASARGDRFD